VRAYREPRTSNVYEREVIDRLRDEGFRVQKRGWPDLIAWRDGEIRLVEVKPCRRCRKLTPAQQTVADVLETAGLHVELDGGLCDWCSGEVQSVGEGG